LAGACATRVAAGVNPAAMKPYDLS
jgi:hypothetical protein